MKLSPISLNWSFAIVNQSGVAEHSRLVLFALSVLIFLPCQLRADADDSDQPVYQLNDIVVRAWHFEKPALDIPADVVRIDRETIDRSLAVSVPDLLEIEANLFFSNLSGSTNVALRGFGEGSGLRSLILIDGHPLNPADMGRINWEQVPLDAIESVEVLRGGHNVLYGDRALSGVIKIETRRPEGSGLGFEGRVGDFGFKQASVSGTLGDEAWGILVGGFRQVSDGYRDNSDTDISNAYIKAGHDLANGSEIDLRLTVGKTEPTYPGSLGEAAYRADPRASENGGDEGSENQYATLTGQAKGEFDWGSWEALTSFDHIDTEWSFGGPYGDNVQAGYSLKPRFRFDPGGWALIAGADLLYDELDFTLYLDEERALTSSEAELYESRAGPYLFAEYPLTERLTLSGGARYEWIRFSAKNTVFVEDQISPTVETNRGPRPNPNYKNPPDIDPEKSYDETIYEGGYSAEVSINFRLTDYLSLWAGYDRAYRYPVFDERATYQGFFLAENVAQDLEAEEGDQFELGLKWVKGVHQIYVTAYLLKMENEIIFDRTEGIDNPNPNRPGIGLNRNLGAVDRYGGDFTHRITYDNWGLSFALAFTHTDVQEAIDGEGVGKEVPLVPSVVTTSQVWWQPWEPLRLRLVHRYVDERYKGGDFANEEQQIESYQLVDVQAEVEVSRNCSVFAKIENLFDELYAESVFLGTYYPGTGRFVQAGLKLNF